LVPAAAALALLSIVTDRDRDVDYDLHLIAPETARAGEVIALRAHLYGGLRRPEGARLIASALEVELRSKVGTLGRAALRPGFASTLEGALTLPANVTGTLQLVARTRPSSKAVTAERSLRVLASPAAAQRMERILAQPLQRFAAGPIVRVHATQPAPDSLEARVTGGQCVPEHACEVWVHVGAPAASVFVQPTPSVNADRASREPGAIIRGVRRLTVVTHGPEAVLELVAQRDEAAVARRSIRLAVGLGSHAFRSMPRVLRQGETAPVGLESRESGCIVDGFHEGRWARTVSLADCRRSEALPGPALAPGLWRLQARRDPFDVQSAAVRTIYVRGAGMTDRSVLMTLAAHVLEHEPEDALARAVGVRREPGMPEPELDDTGEGLALALQQALERQEPYLATFEDTAGYLLAALDEGVMPLPAAVSGHPAALVELAARRSRARLLALATLLLGAFCLALLVAQRGLSAAHEAERVMSDAGEEPRRLQRQRARRTLEVLLSVLAVVLVFLAIAAYILARAS
jgi:hypothetical protein